MKMHKTRLVNGKIVPAKMNEKIPICFEKIIGPISLVSLVFFPILYTAIIYINIYIIGMNDPTFFDILLGTFGRLMKGFIAGVNSFLPIMALYCFFALRCKVLWLFMPFAGIFAPIIIELIFIDDWYTQNPSQSLLQYIYHERMEIIALNLSSVICSCIIYAYYKMMHKNT